VAGGAIATAFVRIRPDVAAFGSEASAGVKEQLKGVQEDVAAATKANVEGAQEAVRANEKVSGSYAEVAEAAKKSAGETAESFTAASGEARNAVARLAESATVGADEAVRANAKVAESYSVIRKEAEGASVESKRVGDSLISGRAFAGAIAGAIAVTGIKDVVEAAASLQKQVELVKEEFGSASGALLDFGNKGAAALGISAQAADTASARLGILFKGLGVGHAQAATATLDLEKLAGSISAIRGINPGTVLQQLPLAVAGNTRSLKQLGIVVDTTQEKVVAFKLGLTQSITQALTPAQKALAIVAIATKNLGTFQDQAKAHAGDLANVTQRLSASFANAKDELGAGLLPSMTKLATFAAAELPSAIKALTTVFRDFSETVKGVAKFVAPAFAPFAKVIGDIKKDFSGGGGGFDALKQQIASLSPIAKIAVVAITGIGVALAALVATAFPITSVIIAIIAVGAALDVAYNHSAKFRAIVADVATFIKTSLIPAFESLLTKLSPVFAQLAATTKKVFGDIVVIIGATVRAGEALWSRFGGTIKEVASNYFSAALEIIKDFLKNVGATFDLLKSIVTGKWSDAWKALETIVGNDLDAIKATFVSWGKDIGDIFSGVWTTIEREALVGVSKVLAVIAGIPTSFHLFGQKIGFTNPAQGALKSVNAAISGIDNAKNAKEVAAAVAHSQAEALRAKTTDPELIGAATAVGTTIKQKIVDAAASSTPGGTSPVTAAASAGVDQAVTDAQQQLETLKTKLTDLISQNKIDIANAVLSAKSNLITIASTLSDQVGQIIDQPFTIANMQIQAAQDKLAAVYDVKNAKLQAQSTKLSRLQAQLTLQSNQRDLSLMRNEVVLPGGGTLSTNAGTASRQLAALARSANNINKPAIEAFIEQYKGAILQVQQDKLGLKQSALDATHQAATARLQIRQDSVQVAQDTANRVKMIAQRSIADFASSLASGAITLKQFNRKLAGLLAADHISYSKAGTLLGSAFATAFQDQVTGISQQAAALAAGPHIAGTGQAPKIVRPEVTAQRDQLKVARLQQEIQSKQLTIQKKIATDTQKSAATLADLKAAQVGATATALAKNPGAGSKRTREYAGTTG
jgi:hypothetical protein